MIVVFAGMVTAWFEFMNTLTSPVPGLPSERTTPKLDRSKSTRTGSGSSLLRTCASEKLPRSVASSSSLVI